MPLCRCDYYQLKCLFGLGGSPRLQRSIRLGFAGGRTRVMELRVSNLGATGATGLQKQTSRVYLRYLGIKMLCHTALAPACEKQPPLRAALNQSREGIQLSYNRLSIFFFLKVESILAGSQFSSVHGVALGKNTQWGWYILTQYCCQTLFNVERHLELWVLVQLIFIYC